MLHVAYAHLADQVLVCVSLSGPAADAVGYFAGLGHKCPTHYNPAEFLADLVSVDYSSPDTERASKYVPLRCCA